MARKPAVAIDLDPSKLIHCSTLGVIFHDNSFVRNIFDCELRTKTRHGVLQIVQSKPSKVGSGTAHIFTASTPSYAALNIAAPKRPPTTAVGLNQYEDGSRLLVSTDATDHELAIWTIQACNEIFAHYSNLQAFSREEINAILYQVEQTLDKKFSAQRGADIIAKHKQELQKTPLFQESNFQAAVQAAARIVKLMKRVFGPNGQLENTCDLNRIALFNELTISSLSASVSLAESPLMREYKIALGSVRNCIEKIGLLKLRQLDLTLREERNPVQKLVQDAYQYAIGLDPECIFKGRASLAISHITPTNKVTHISFGAMELAVIDPRTDTTWLGGSEENRRRWSQDGTDSLEAGELIPYSTIHLAHRPTTVINLTHQQRRKGDMIVHITPGVLGNHRHKTSHLNHKLEQGVAGIRQHITTNPDLASTLQGISDDYRYQRGLASLQNNQGNLENAALQILVI